MDEDNEEVLQLIRGMHDFAEPRESTNQNKPLLIRTGHHRRSGWLYLCALAII